MGNGMDVHIAYYKLRVEYVNVLLVTLWILWARYDIALYFRRGHDDLGDHYLDYGDLSNALKCYSRARDYCTSPKHVVNMCLNVIKVHVDNVFLSNEYRSEYNKKKHVGNIKYWVNRLQWYICKLNLWSNEWTNFDKVGFNGFFIIYDLFDRLVFIYKIGRMCRVMWTKRRVHQKWPRWVFSLHLTSLICTSFPIFTNQTF